jgi:hypothetical protein
LIVSGAESAERGRAMEALEGSEIALGADGDRAPPLAGVCYQ